MVSWYSLLLKYMRYKVTVVPPSSAFPLFFSIFAILLNRTKEPNLDAAT